MAADDEAAWRRALYHVLGLVAGSAWADGLVLRGSVLLPEWLGARARQPGDLDWVVRPPSRTISEQSTVDMFDGLTELLRQNSVVDDTTRLDVARVRLESIWSYDRAPGRRLSVSTRLDGRPGRYVSMDFVFNEPLPEVPLWTTVGGAEVWAASPELSLAWKLLWLSTDQYPEGKDLYDATLLAEYATVPLDLLRRVLAREWGDEADDFTAETVLEWAVQWDSLRRVYPWIEGSDVDWQYRLAAALAPTFATD